MKQRGLIIAVCAAAGSILIDAKLLPAQVAPTTHPSTDWATLINQPGTSLTQRETAASQLLRENSSHSRQILQRILENSGDAQGQIAVAHALSTSINPDPQFLVPLRLMMGVDRNLTEAACMAISNYKDNTDALRLLINFASSRQLRETDRTLAIRAIGIATDKSAAEFLVSLVARDDDAQRIRYAAADTLIEMTVR